MRVIAVFAGRFHPFHRGHAASFKQLAQKFGLDNTYLAISSKQEQPKSPFAAQDRAKMAMALGIPAKNIIAVRNPYAAQDYIDQLKLDPEKTAIVFGASKKDMEGDPALGIPPDPRFSFLPKRDGNPAYLQPYTTKSVKPMSQHGYVMSTDVAEFPIAGKSMRDASAIRKAYAGADQKTKMRILKDLYGDSAEQMKQVFDNNLQVTENIKRLISAIKPMLGEATVQQKAKLVKLLSESRGLVERKIDEMSRKVSRHSLDILKDLGNGYYLVDDSDEDYDVYKEGFAVVKEIPGSDRFEWVDTLRVSPYPRNRQPGDVEREIERILNQDNGINEEEKTGIEKAYRHPETHDILSYAQKHYPQEPDLQAAFVKFVLRSLNHSKKSGIRHDMAIDSLENELAKIKQDHKSTMNNVSEILDYLEEK